MGGILFWNPGSVSTGLFRVFCSTFHHSSRGMSQIYEVSSCGRKEPSEQPYGMIRTFYIAAEEVEWDYAPNKNWEFEKQHMDAGGERYHGLWGSRLCSRDPCKGGREQAGQDVPVVGDQGIPSPVVPDGLLGRGKGRWVA